MKWLKMAILSGLAAIIMPGCDTGVSSGRSETVSAVPAINSEMDSQRASAGCAEGVCGIDLGAAAEQSESSDGCAEGVCGIDLKQAFEKKENIKDAAPAAEQMPTMDEMAAAAVQAVQLDEVREAANAAA